MAGIRWLRGLIGDERGLEGVEYAVVAALITTAIVAAVAVLGPALLTGFTNVASLITK